MLEIKGFIPVSLIDYPSKICSVVFLGGCNFRCPWCHNFDLVDEQSLKNIETISFDYILSFIDSRKGKIDGLCISGGEPTIHEESLIDFIKKIKKKEIPVKLDTNGSNPLIIEKLINEKLIDFIAIDIKNTAEKYPMTVGLKFFDFSTIIESLQIIKKSGIKFQTRTTVVPKIVDKKEMENLSKKLKIDIFFQEYKKRS
ncbi:MAG: anaerobic ribonucleoside-triphosphate reductase activating protein [Exilispira sp.]